MIYDQKLSDEALAMFATFKKKIHTVTLRYEAD